MEKQDMAEEAKKSEKMESEDKKIENKKTENNKFENNKFENKKSIEEMLDEVDDIIMSLENGDIALEDSFKIYEKGMKMIQTINSRIDKVEKKIIAIDTKEQSGEEA